MRCMTPTCPRCPETALATSGTHGVWVQYCPRCWGLWLDHAAVQHAVGPAIDGATAAAGDALPCPICRAAMRPWRAREVVIDRCDAHGVWFDRAELDSLVAHARGTGPSGLAIAGGVAGGMVLGAVALDAAQLETRGTSGEDTFATAVDAASVAAPVVDSAGELAAGAGELVVAGAEATGGVLEGIGEAVGAIFEWFS
jgi:Zn-finger nucleic acid-binding protein